MEGYLSRECHLGVSPQAATSIPSPCGQGALKGKGMLRDSSLQTVSLVCCCHN